MTDPRRGFRARWARPSKTRPQGAGSVRDSGLSFVEITVAVAILGITASALFGAMFASTQTSARARSTALLERTTQDAFDRINRAPMACNYSSQVTAALQGSGLPASAATITYRRYVPSADLADPGQWMNGACLNGAVTEGLVQSITVTITSGAGSATVSRESTMVKSND
jgi:type II secretory pathway pseudopilin PulG